MRGLMIAAVAVAGLTLGGQAQAQDESMMKAGQNGGQRPIEQMESVFPDEMRQAPLLTQTPVPGVDPRAAGTGGSGSLRSETMEIKGTIRSVSDKGMTLTVPKDDRIVTLYSDGQVQLLQDNKPLALSSLQLGQEVRASYEFNQDGQKVLRSLEVIHDKGEHSHKK